MLPSKQPVLFVSHGGGPLPLLGDPSHDDMVRRFRNIREYFHTQVPKPDAIVYISAHWEASPLAITAAPVPELYYDYYNFPDEAYTFKYPVPGAPELASRLQRSLVEAGIPVELDQKRGLDHGVFIPGLLLFSEADVPTLQLSLHPELDPSFHLALGQQLEALREKNVLIVGSGFSFHNMREFFRPSDVDADAKNLAFEEWLEETLQLADQEARKQRLIDWENAPHARFCHPREEHLLPLHVCVGAAGDATLRESWHFAALGKQGSCYLW